MTNDVQGRALRVLIVSQSASEFGVRKICEALSLHSGVRVRALGPRRGYYPLGGRVVETPRSSHGAYDLVNGRVYRAMADFSNPYLTGLLREVLRFRPDVIHVFNEAYSGVHAQAVLYRNLFRPGALCFSTGAQNVIPRRVKSKREQFKRRFAHRHVDGVACWSTGAKQALIEAGFPSPRLAVTHWGVPLEAFFPARNDARREAMGAARDFVLGYVGRIELQKGLWTLLLAMRRLPSSVKCLCIGDGRLLRRQTARVWPGRPCHPCADGARRGRSVVPERDGRPGSAIGEHDKSGGTIRARASGGDGMRGAGDRIGFGRHSGSHRRCGDGVCRARLCSACRLCSAPGGGRGIAPQTRPGRERTGSGPFQLRGVRSAAVGPLPTNSFPARARTIGITGPAPTNSCRGAPGTSVHRTLDGWIHGD